MSRSSRALIASSSRIEDLYSASVHESARKLGCAWLDETLPPDDDEPTIITSSPRSFRNVSVASISVRSDSAPDTLRDSDCSWSDRIPVDVELTPSMSTMSMPMMMTALAIPRSLVRDQGMSTIRPPRRRHEPKSPRTALWQCVRLLLATVLIGFVLSTAFLIVTKRGRAPAHAIEVMKKGWHSVSQLGHHTHRKH